jgi:hypothetical protein
MQVYAEFDAVFESVEKVEKNSIPKKLLTKTRRKY